MSNLFREQQIATRAFDLVGSEHRLIQTLINTKKQ